MESEQITLDICYNQSIAIETIVKSARRCFWFRFTHFYSGGVVGAHPETREELLCFSKLAFKLHVLL